MDETILLLNFAHPLTAAQRAQIEALVGEGVRERRVVTQIDEAAPLVAQVAALADTVGLDAEGWQTTPLLVNLPGYAPAAGCLLVEIHARAGHFPAMVRLRPAQDSLTTRYEVAEVVELQRLRSAGRRRRSEQEQRQAEDAP